MFSRLDSRSRPPSARPADPDPRVRPATARALVAILCALIAFTSAPHALADDEDKTTLDRPVRISLRVDDEREMLRGALTSWSYGAFWIRHGGAPEAERIDWERIDSETVYSTTRRLFDQREAIAHFRLGVALLQLNDDRLAERAFRQAVRLDSRLNEVAEFAVRVWSNGEDPAPVVEQARNALGAAGQAQRTPTRLPEVGLHAPDDSQARSGTETWPTLGPEERERALELQRQFVLTAGHGAGDNPRRVHETENFIIASDLPEHDILRWGERLETTHALLCDMFGVPEGKEIYAGKCMVFVFGSRHAFLNFERRALGIDASGAGGICHYRSDDVILSFYRWGGETEFHSVMVHESVHAFLYRYGSPARPPRWLNEGLAEFIAGHLTPASTEPAEHWTIVRNLMLNGRDPEDVMRQFYHQDWTVSESYATSHMIVRFLLRYKPEEFRQWIDDIEKGDNWVVAMGKRFGVDIPTLAVGFAEEIKSERRYQRIR